MGVIIILGIIALIAIPIVDGQLKEGRKDLSKTQISNIKEAVETWGAANIYNLPENGDNCYLKYSTLVDGGYLDDELKELSSNEFITDTNLKIEISKDENYNKYNYLVEFDKEGYDIPDKYCNAKYEYSNLVKNGSFEDGLEEWSIPFGDGSNVLLLNDRHVISTNGENFVQQIISWSENHIYYYTAEGLGNENNSGIIMCDISQSPTGLGFSTWFSFQANQTSWVRSSKIINMTISLDRVISVGYSTNMNGTFYFDNVIVIDLTETFGAGNEPDKEWCDENLNYIDYGKTNYAYYK